MPFPPVKRVKVSDQMTERIRDAIVAGTYAAGSPLPTERDLAEQFGVNRSSVREALHRLEAWGLVEIRHGTGAWVSNFLATAGLQLLPFLIAPGGQIDAKMLLDLLELRVELLGYTGARAAEKARSEDLTALEHVVTALEGATSLRQRQELDFDFFELLVALSDNTVLALVSNAIRQVYLQNSALFAPMYASDFDTIHHRNTLEALRNRDAHAAREAMRAYGERVLGRTP